MLNFSDVLKRIINKPKECTNTVSALTKKLIKGVIMADAILTVERIQEALNYDPSTGIFSRKLRTAQRHQVGDRADCRISNGLMMGYCRVTLDGKRYLAHRLAWFYTYGEWPNLFIDHINGNKSDNSIDNLRDASPRTNVENLKTSKKSNLGSNYLGVFKYPNDKWRARIQVNGESVHLGMFDSQEKASDAYLLAKRQLHQGCTI